MFAKTFYLLCILACCQSNSLMARENHFEVTDLNFPPAGIEDGYMPDADSSETATLTRLSKKWMDAMLHHDSATLVELMAPEYKLQKWDGTSIIPRSVWMNNLFHHIKIDHFEQSNIVSQVYGDVAVVTSVYSWSGAFYDHAFNDQGYLVDTWVRRNNKWQVITRSGGVFPGGKTLTGK
jgi:hypothetical protein